MDAAGTTLPTPRQPAPRWRELLQQGRTPLTVGLITIELLAGLESLIVTAAMPRVLRDLGGVSFYGLVFSGYFLAGLASIPVAGREADRRGPAVPFLMACAVFAAGTLLCGFAPSMPLLAAARLLQGYGGGALYTVAYTAVGRAYPEPLRPRLYSLLAGTWVASALVGPLTGAVLASTVGWRAAFWAALPLLAAAVALATPGLRRSGGGDAGQERLPVRPPLQLAAGTGLCMAGLSVASWLTAPALVAGMLLMLPALRVLLPAGTLRARPGRGAAVVAAFLLNVGFFTADSFVPLAITGVRHRSIAVSGVAVTVVVVGWSVGAWYQGRRALTVPPVRLLRQGAGLLLAGTLGVASTVLGAPLALAIGLWAVAGVGMGLAYQTVLLASTNARPGEGDGSLMAARFLSGRLGIALGTGVGGGLIATAVALHLPLAVGLGAVFTLGLLGSATCLVLSGRVSPARVAA
ncbi:MAG: MFS transporter [Candidatus Dormibacteria bacterium]